MRGWRLFRWMVAGGLCLIIYSSAFSEKLPYVCGDADGSGMVQMSDIPYLMSYIFAGGTAPVENVLSGNADACGSQNCAVNVADCRFLAEYLFGGGTSPGGCTNTSDCSVDGGSNYIVRIGNPPYTPYPASDSFAVPVYINNASPLGAISVALQFMSSDNLVINSVSWTGSMLNGADSRTADFEAGKVLFGGCYFTSSLPPLSNALLVTLNVRDLGKRGSRATITFEKTFFAPGGDCIFRATNGAIYNPTLEGGFDPFIVTNLNDAGGGSLRAAIAAANSTPGQDTIRFDVSGTLDLTNLLALTDDSTVILGSSAPGGARSFIINGGNDADRGLDVQSSYNKIEDIIIYAYTDYHIRLQGDSNVVRGCYINLDATGENPEVAFSGIEIGGRLNIVGGCTEADKNIICASGSFSTNDGRGVRIYGNRNTIAGNFIGVTPDGNDYFPLCDVGIECSGDTNIIGGDAAECRNVIFGVGSGINLYDGEHNEVYNNFIGLKASGDDILCPTFDYFNAGIMDTAYGQFNLIGGPDGKGNFIAGFYQGIVFWDDSNYVIGNYIGTDTTGSVDLDMYGDGILNIWGNRNKIGDTLPGHANIISACNGSGLLFEGGDSSLVVGNYIGTNPQGDDLGNDLGIKIQQGSGLQIIRNTIAYNAQQGILIDTFPTNIHNIISRNQIYNNGELGLDLGGDGVTANDAGDVDDGPNDLLNFPTITNTEWQIGKYRVSGSTEEAGKVEIYAVKPAGISGIFEDPSHHGEAYSYLGAFNIGRGSFDTLMSIDDYTLATMLFIDNDGNTSEFSENFSLAPSPLIIVAYSPINLWITDPLGDSIGLTANGTPFQTIFPASYTETVEGNDSVHIDFPLVGDYIIEVVTEDGAAPDDTLYTIGVRIDGTEQCILVEEADVPDAGIITSYTYVVEEDWHYINGDANRDGIVNILDILYLIDYKFKGGPPPDPMGAGDNNCNQVVNIIDIVYLIDHKFKGGPEPCHVEEY